MIWKAVVVILNCRFTAAITYHNSFHVLWEGCGTETATLEVNLIQHVAALMEAVLHVIFMDLQKDYNALDRSRCLGILEGYGVGPRSLRLLQRYWENLNMVAQAGEYYVTPFCGKRGVTQGDPLSPTIFNVVVDTVVCHWESLVTERNGSIPGLWT